MMENNNIIHPSGSGCLNGAHIDTFKMPNQKRSFSQRQKPGKSIFSTNTFPSKLKRNNINNNSIRQQADIIRYTHSQNIVPDVQNVQNMFAPDVHSTPIYNPKNHPTKKSNKRNSSVENASIQNTYQPHIAHHSNVTNEYELHRLHSYPNVPTISKKVEMGNDQTLYGSSSITCTESKIVKRRGIRGVSWIFRLAMNDDSIGKIYRAQLGWTLLTLLAFLMIGAILGCFSKYFSTSYTMPFSNYSDVSPKYEFIDSNKFNVNSYPSLDEKVMMSTEQDISTTIYRDINNQLTTLSSKLLMSTNETNQVENKTEITTNASIKRNANNETTTDELRNVCKECRKVLDVCIVNASSGVPTCKAAIDVEDPTGCGGLCALEIEACHLLDKNHSIYICSPLETIRRCKANEWMCGNQLCINKSKHCDGEFNCYDLTDEYDCDACDLKKNFHCGNETSCISNSKKCNGVIDCWDAFDEVNCTTICPGDQFTCNSGQCISELSFCDGVPDCKDSSDEPKGC